MFRPGDDLGRYRIIETIGLGGMGVVYRARDTVLNRDVAIKAMAGGVPSNPNQRQRFLQELENAPRVVHPFVTTVFDVVDRTDGPVLVMELVEGLRLDHYIEDENPPLATIARLGAEIAEALSAIHAVGIVHRDLKPGNILITPDLHAKVMDFGVALRLARFDRTDLATNMDGERHTDSGAIVGTISYMSPEQLRGEEPGERSDLFALGIVLCEAVTGHHPFPGETPAEVAGAILHASPGDADDRAKLAECGSLGTTILRLLEKNPQDRIASARETAEQLHAATAHWTASAFPAQRRFMRTILAGTLVLFAIGGALYTFRDALFGDGRRPGPVAAQGARPAVAVIPFESGATGPGRDVGLMVADLIAAQLGESSRLRPIAIDRVAECLAALPKDTSAAVSRSRLAQATPAAWIVSGTVYSEGAELLASVSVFARDQSDPSSSFQVRGTKPSQLASRALERLQAATGAAEIAGFLPGRAAPLPPADPQAADLLRRARDAARGLDYTHAIDLLEEALRRDASFLDAQILLADLLDRAGYARRAGQVADRAIAQAKSLGLPDDARQSLQARVAKARIAGGAPHVTALRALAARYPDEPQILRDLAMAIRQSQPDEAGTVIARAIELDPGDARCYLVQSRVLDAQNRPKEALLAVDKAEAIFKSFGATAALGEVAQARGYAHLVAADYDAARDDFRAARTVFTGAERPVAALAAVAEEADMELLRYRVDDAGRLYTQAIPGLKAAGNYARVVDALSGYGAALMRAGQIADAEAKYVEAADLARSLDNPALVALPLGNLSYLYIKIGRFGEAKSLAAELVDSPPAEVRSDIRCAASLFGAMAAAGEGHMTDAIDRLERYASTDLAMCGPERAANAVAQQAWYFFQIGASEKALASLNRAIALLDGPKPPADLAFYFAERARVGAWLGRTSDAARDLARAEAIAGDPKGRGVSLASDLCLARAALALARGDQAGALRETQVKDAGTGDIRAALTLLHGELLVAIDRPAEARKLLESADARGIMAATDKASLRYLAAAVGLREGRQGDALRDARAALAEPVTNESPLLSAKLLTIAVGAAAEPSVRADFVAQLKGATRKLLESAPAETREWLATHWGLPGPTPELSKRSP